MSEPTKMALMVPNLLLEGGRAAGGPRGLLPVPDVPKKVNPATNAELMEMQLSDVTAFVRPWESVVDHETESDREAHLKRALAGIGNPKAKDYRLPNLAKRRLK